MFNEENCYQETCFQLPIEFLNNKQKLSDHLINDLELTKTVHDDTKPVYDTVFNPSTEIGKKSIKSWSKYYTTNKHFLKDSQKLYKNANAIPFDKLKIERMIDSWKNIRNQNNFLEKYQYVDFERLLFLNKSTIFLSILSLYNISSPVINLIAPFFVLIVPFAVLKVMNLPITWQSYYKILIENIKHHAIGKLLFSFNQVALGQKIYIMFLLGMYFYNIYQNIISCYRFYVNARYIAEEFETLNEYLDYTKNKIKLYLKITDNYKTYKPFNNKLKDYLDRIEKFHYEIKAIPTNQTPLQKLLYIGKSMKYFYTLYESYELENLMSFTFGFHGYIDTILGINKQINTKTINPITFSKSNKFKLKKMFYPNLKNPVKNNIDISKNHIITGPNAAGKTTLIKASIINLLLTQQIGYGYFDKGMSGTFKHIHCYLNIPDSCSRDSLFQAEARRCKNIIDKIKDNPNDTHFCIFDELYSGTNPYEAISSAYSYLTHISKNKKIKFMLTTHFIRLCNLLEKHKNVVNKSMKTTVINNDPNYTYKITDGISRIKGGVCVLKQLNYPQEIIDTTTKVLENL